MTNTAYMKISEVEFIKSSSKLKECPDTELDEFAFIGRSNVGKSSLINMLLNRNKLAKVSGVPGKTQLINHFIIDNKWYLVDLPGYGWAKASKTKKEQWSKMIQNYLLYRKNLSSVFILVDSRLKPQQIDIDFINWLGNNKLPLSIVFTKIDKKSKIDINKVINLFRTELLKTWENLPRFFLTSSKNKFGRDEILEYFAEILKN